MNITIQDIFDFVQANPSVCNMMHIPIDPPILIPVGSRFYNIEILQDIHVNKVTCFMNSKRIFLRSLEPQTLIHDPDKCFLFLNEGNLTLEGLYSPRIAFELMNRLKKLTS